MPFDGTDFRRRGSRGDNFATAFIIGIAALLLAAPISLAALIDILRQIKKGLLF